MVSVASAVLRLNPARPMQAPVKKCVTGSKCLLDGYSDSDVTVARLAR